MISVDDSNDAMDGSDRKNVDEQSSNQDVPMQHDDVLGSGGQDDSNHTSNGNGNGMTSRAIDVDEPDTHVTNNEREKPNPFSRNRNNFNSSGNDGGTGYGMHRESAAVIVNTNLLPFIQKLHDTMREEEF